jgi:hypothetical protein
MVKKERERMSNEKLGNINFQESNGNPIIKSDESMFPESFYFSKFYEEKAYTKFIKNIERTVRSSKEYKSYIEVLRSNVGALNFDNVLNNITNADAELEFHHYPFTLYELVDMVCVEKFLKKEKFTTFSIAKEIMSLHYKNLVGLVPLTKTNHELAHNGSLFFSKKQVFGEYDKLIERFNETLSSEIKEKLKRIDELTDSNAPSDIGGLF